MKISDLKNGMVVKTRNNDIFVIIDEFLVDKLGHIPIRSYNEDMTLPSYIDKNGIYDIMELYEKCETLNLENHIHTHCPIWKREETPIEVTMAEIEEKFGQPVKIVKEKEEDTYKMDISSWDELFPPRIISLNYKGGFIKNE